MKQTEKPETKILLSGNYSPDQFTGAKQIIKACGKVVINPVLKNHLTNASSQKVN